MVQASSLHLAFVAQPSSLHHKKRTPKASIQPDRRLFPFGRATDTMMAMPSDDEIEKRAREDPAGLLAEAIERSKALLERLIQEQAQIEQNPPKISPEALREGRAAMANAIAAARRTVDALDAASKIEPDQAFEN